MQDDIVRQIKERLDIVDIISDRVRLHKSGANWVGLCPFHEEKTPSFSVSQERQFYHCFGCGKGGDIFTFVKETEGFDFQQTLEFLARRAGVDISKRGKSPSRARSSYDVLEVANTYFINCLRSPEGVAARAYLERRKVPSDVYARYELGWSLSSWNGLSSSLQKQGITTPEMLELGLVSQGQQNVYDRFRGRVMFPIRDISGRLLAFGGRLIDGDGPKYMNSPEGPLYSKRKNLYLLHAAKNAIKQKRRAILVEGYMDALRMHMCGYDETVASLGTALTEEQAGLIKRFSDRCYLCYDSDAAGQDATLRGMYLLQNMGLDVYVISLPREKDPDALLAEGEDGEHAFREALDSARPLVLHHLHNVEPLLDNAETRKSGVTSLFEGISQLRSSDLAPHLRRIAGALNMSEDELRAELRGFAERSGRQRRRETAPDYDESGDFSEDDFVDPLEAALCAVVWSYPACRSCDPAEILPLVNTPRVKELLFAIMNESPEQLHLSWLSTGEDWPLRVIAQGESFCVSLEHGREFEIVRDELEKKRSARRYAELRAKMRRDAASEDEIAEVTRLAHKLKGGNGVSQNP